MRCVMRKLIKKYLKHLNKDQRDFRMMFRGKRLIAKQHSWLYYQPAHPWE
jgi:hypothetical protein